MHVLDLRQKYQLNWNFVQGSAEQREERNNPATLQMTLMIHALIVLVEIHGEEAPLWCLVTMIVILECHRSVFLMEGPYARFLDKVHQSNLFGHVHPHMYDPLLPTTSYKSSSYSDFYHQ